MRIMLRWIRIAPGAVAYILLCRWMFRLGNPQQDWWHVVEAWQGVQRRLAGWRVRMLDTLGITGLSWRILRSRYQRGEFGTEGT